MSQRYVKHKVLGRGNYGAAHLVQDVRSQEWFVMKEVALEGLDERASKSALAEAALLATLKHIFIVRYKDSFKSKNNLYIVMEVRGSAGRAPAAALCAVSRTFHGGFTHTPAAAPGCAVLRRGRPVPPREEATEGQALLL